LGGAVVRHTGAREVGLAAEVGGLAPPPNDGGVNFLGVDDGDEELGAGVSDEGTMLAAPARPVFLREGIPPANSPAS
jgi:hypothetical protein